MGAKPVPTSPTTQSSPWRPPRHRSRPRSRPSRPWSCPGSDRSFDAVKALSDVSLEIVPGEIHALLGENGAGKSTLMAIASGELAPDAGTIFVAGFEQPQLTPRLANSLGIAIVHQHPALLEDMTIAENIRLAVPADKLLFAGTEKESMRSLLDEVGLDAHLNDRVDTLSLANKHLLEVIKALASSPQILILDEPTAPLGREAVDTLFSHVTAAAQRGTAVVYITHRLAEVRQLASRATVLRDGKVSGAAQVDEVSDEQLFGWIVGRRLVGSTFPAKPDLSTEPEGYLSITGLDGAGFSDMSITASTGRDRRDRRRHWQRTDRVPGRAGRTRLVPGNRRGGWHVADRQRAQGEGGVHAGRSAPGGAHDVPVGAGERRGERPAAVHSGFLHPTCHRVDCGEVRAHVIECPGTDDPSAGHFPVRREPAEGGGGEGVAVATGHADRRRADARGRRRSPRRDLPHPQGNRL